ncbi:class II aldolase like protein [Dothistroma septosporum NZE10]|uniref:Class II aldolase like protein n=1 Tax=Dothistroma septosporum (strain NZE10 / CBS 128990) TaxID=675120 RepID=N1PFJ6_DOTSN|nr:class II aldolase like protein [Dothistroma septosporum NZE10]
MTSDDTRSALLRASKPPSKDLFSTLITANHILHYHSVVDAFGHISVRNPQNPATFFISKSLAPALVSQREDLEEYYVEDASPVNKDAPKGYAERFIHSEIYKKYKSVNAVVHAHSESVLPFAINSVPLRPVFHMSGVMGSTVPVYDIQNHYKSSDALHSLLVNNQHLGEGLANGFNPSTLTSKATSMIKNYITSSQPAPVDFPQHPTVLMRGHGFTCVASTIEECVYRAIFTCTNARVQTTALLMQGGYNQGLIAERFGLKEEQPGQAGVAKQEGLKFLSEREAKDAWTAMQRHAERPWKLWCEEVRVCGLYRNGMEGEEE